MKADLAKLVDEVQQKNKILAFTSCTDQMTETFNRHGFMKEALKFARAETGKKAFFLMADLDRLKEINDCYGHPEGDYAIRTSADILKEVLGTDALIARIGGDEFVAIALKNDNVDCKFYHDRIKEKCIEINESTKKPFYVEMSVGIKEFTCNKEVDFDLLLKEVDNTLYKDKHGRRTSIKK